MAAFHLSAFAMAFASMVEEGLIQAVPSSSPNCPATSTNNEFIQIGNYCLLQNFQLYNWTNAKEMCAHKYRARLPALRDLDEKDALLKFMQEKGMTETWTEIANDQLGGSWTRMDVYQFDCCMLKDPTSCLLVARNESGTANTAGTLKIDDACNFEPKYTQHQVICMTSAWNVTSMACAPFTGYAWNRTFTNNDFEEPQFTCLQHIYSINSQISNTGNALYRWDASVYTMHTNGTVPIYHYRNMSLPSPLDIFMVRHIAEPMLVNLELIGIIGYVLDSSPEVSAKQYYHYWGVRDNMIRDSMITNDTGLTNDPYYTNNPCNRVYRQSSTSSFFFPSESSMPKCIPINTVISDQFACPSTTTASTTTSTATTTTIPETIGLTSMRTTTTIPMSTITSTTTTTSTSTLITTTVPDSIAPTSMSTTTAIPISADTVASSPGPPSITLTSNCTPPSTTSAGTTTTSPFLQTIPRPITSLCQTTTTTSTSMMQSTTESTASETSWASITSPLLTTSSVGSKTTLTIESPQATSPTQSDTPPPLPVTASNAAYQWLTEMANLEPSKYDPVARTSVLQATQPYILSHVPIEMMLEIGIQWEQLVKRCAYDGDSCYQEKDFQPVPTSDMGVCYTFNFDHAKQLNATRAGRGHGLFLILEMLESEYICTTTTAGFKITLQDPQEAPFPANTGFYVNPGVRTSVVITKNKIKKISDCQPDTWLNGISYYYNGSYTLEGCMRGCYQDYAIRECECADPKYAKPPNVEYCGVADMRCLEYLQTCGQIDISKESGCNCMEPCEHEYYDISTSTSAINVDSAKLHGLCEGLDATKRSKTCEQHIKRGIAIVEIFYNALQYMEYEEVDTYPIDKFLLDISQVCGISFNISIYLIFELFILILVIIFASDQLNPEQQGGGNKSQAVIAAVQN